MTAGAVRPIAAVLMIVSTLASGGVQAADLTVHVTGLANSDGDVHVAVYDDPAGFPTSDGMRAQTYVGIENARAVVVFRGLEPGRYAVAAYHDENGNHEFDQIIFGIPVEDYGFSNDAPVFFGPPSFDAAAFDVAEPATAITVNMGN